MSIPTLTRNTLLALFLGATASGQLLDQSDQAAAAFGVDAGTLIEAHVDQLAFPNLGLEITRFKAVEAGTGRILRLDLDAAGQRADVAWLRAAEAAAIAANPEAKMDAALRTARDSADGSERLPVVAWIAMDGRALDAYAADRLRDVDGRDTPRADLVLAEADVRANVIARVGAVVEAFRAAANADGLIVRSTARTAPMAFLDVTVGELATLAARADVRALFLETDDHQDLNEDANGSHRTNFVKWSGVRGNGIRVAVLENNGVLAACPYLNVADWFNSTTYNPDQHIHGTMGCVASTKADRTGAAPDVELYCANASSYSDSNVVDAADWVGGNDIDITNLSWGNTTPSASLNSFDHYFNYASRYLRDSYVAAAGNDGASEYVSSPGKAHNVIAVGSFDDHENSSWSDDDMSSFSSGRDPANGCQKPNLVANGHDVDTLGYPSPWETDSYSGTSFASPHLAGNLADAMSVNAEPVLSPEAAMALMMATAWHNIEGDELLSDKDGAGGLHGWAAYQCAKDGRVDGGWLNEDSFNAFGQHTYKVYLEGGKKTRVCVAWSAEDAGFGGPDILTSLIVDLDIMAISNPDGGAHVVYDSSASSTNNFEMLEFTPSATAWYGIRLEHGGTISGSDIHPWGIAWSQTCDQDLFTLGEVFGMIPFGNLYTMGPTIGSDFELAGMFPGANVDYAVLPSGTLGEGLPLDPDGNHWLPLSFDIWTNIWLHTLGQGGPWVNTIGSSGEDGIATDINLELPYKPSLVGTRLHHVAMTMDANLEIASVGQPLAVTLLPPPVAVPVEPLVSVPLPFDFKFYGETYNEVFVSEDGYVTFEQPEIDPTESADELLSGPPRIAYAYDDLDRLAPGASLQMRVVAQGARQLMIEMVAVPEDGAQPGSSNTARLVLHENGVIETGYVRCDLRDAIVGISPGHGQSAAGPIDITSSGEVTSGQMQALYEVFDGAQNSFDLGAKPLSGGKLIWNVLRFVPVDPTNTNYRLEMTVR